MERLEIENFLCIKKADLDIKRFNVIIGPQASGKSVLAKLAYFFKEIFKIQFQKEVLIGNKESEFVRNYILSFEEIFPRYAWRKSFKVKYSRDNIWISINYAYDTDLIELKFSDEFSEFYKSQLEQFKAEVEQSGETNQIDSNLAKYSSLIVEARKLLKDYFDLRSIFIPASRTILAVLQKNMFAFLQVQDKIKIDPFLDAFGSIYNTYKKRYGSKTLYAGREKMHNELAHLVSEVIRGQYIHDGEDWIINENSKTRLEDASSGQQEAVPMLVFLSVYPFLKSTNRLTYFIEEPESHLFPTAQKHIVSLLATLYNICESNFFITTHSPYILTAINNLITAEQAYATGKNNQRVEALVPTNQHLRYDDVAAYTIKDGVLCSIMDEENKIIGPSIIDEVSDDFDSTFDGLLDVLYGGK